MGQLRDPPVRDAGYEPGLAQSQEISSFFDNPVYRQNRIT